MQFDEYNSIKTSTNSLFSPSVRNLDAVSLPTVSPPPLAIYGNPKPVGACMCVCVLHPDQLPMNNPIKYSQCGITFIQGSPIFSSPQTHALGVERAPVAWRPPIRCGSDMNPLTQETVGGIGEVVGVA
ncbi:hypothetical protein CDAR_468361 [Caerostris darwini]|uniref:DUF4150 domain-containing protein n=1 Tax=Caerostris darwini TaxID=1538125 RepID=A0AAV4WXY8_9ARAC|nr:hypothetical protein CDAR_468361 [Caerostris darwini]